MTDCPCCNRPLEDKNNTGDGFGSYNQTDHHYVRWWDWMGSETLSLYHDERAYGVKIWLDTKKVELSATCPYEWYRVFPLNDIDLDFSKPAEIIAKIQLLEAIDA